MLYLVRHARTIKDRTRPAGTWALDPEGAADLLALRHAVGWDAVPRWFSSPEPKARQTAAALTTRPVRVVEGLREVRRPGWDDHYDATVTRLFSVPDAPAAPDWETADEALGRFDRSLREVVRPGVDTAVVTHGLVLSAWRAMLRRSPVDMDEWRRLRFPDLMVLSDAGIERWLAGDPRPMDLTWPVPSGSTGAAGSTGDAR